MSTSGLRQVRELTSQGFHYDNLVKMAGHCREEKDPKRLLSAYLLNRIFAQMADELGDGLVISAELRKLEAKYRTLINLALEKALAGVPQEEQNGMFIELIQRLWTAPETA